MHALIDAVTDCVWDCSCKEVDALVSHLPKLSSAGLSFDEELPHGIGFRLLNRDDFRCEKLPHRIGFSFLNRDDFSFEKLHTELDSVF